MAPRAGKKKDDSFSNFFDFQVLMHYIPDLASDQIWPATNDSPKWESKRRFRSDKNKKKPTNFSDYDRSEQQLLP